MSTVPIKDEHRVGTEARFKVEPSAYLQKLFQSGTPDLSWMKETGEWGMRAKPSALGLRLKDVEVGSYGVVPERGGAHLSMAPRGSVIPDNVPSLGFTINNKDECWADNVTELYEEAVARANGAPRATSRGTSSSRYPTTSSVRCASSAPFSPRSSSSPPTRRRVG